MIPHTQLLTIKDLDSCVELENATFPENLRCSREKFIYRLTKCPDLCMGVFTMLDTNSENETDKILQNTATALTSRELEVGSGCRAVLLAHIVATKTNNYTVLDEDMALPPDWQFDGPGVPSKLGHKPSGKTVALHSLAVLPEYQSKGLGSLFLRSYIHRIIATKAGQRISLITFDYLLPFYSKFGFDNMGKSSAEFGGEAWNDMVLSFPEEDLGVGSAGEILSDHPPTPDAKSPSS